MQANNIKLQELSHLNHQLNSLFVTVRMYLYFRFSFSIIFCHKKKCGDRNPQESQSNRQQIRQIALFDFVSVLKMLGWLFNYEFITCVYIRK